MKQWTIEELYNLYLYRGDSRKTAMKKAEIDFKKMHSLKDKSEQHQIMQEMLYD